MSGYVTDSDETADCDAIKNGVVSVRPELHSSIEEADCCLIPHVHNAVQCQSKRVLILSNDTDVVLYTLAYQFVDTNSNKIMTAQEVASDRGSVIGSVLAKKGARKDVAANETSNNV